MIKAIINYDKEGILSGKVFNTNSKQSIPNSRVMVSLDSFNESQTTNNEGEFRIIGIERSWFYYYIKIEVKIGENTGYLEKAFKVLRNENFNFKLESQIFNTHKNKDLFWQMYLIADDDRELLKKFHLDYEIVKRLEEIRSGNIIPNYGINEFRKFINLLYDIDFRVEWFRRKYPQSFAFYPEEFKSPTVQELYKLIRHENYISIIENKTKIFELIDKMPEILEIELKDSINYAGRAYYTDEETGMVVHKPFFWK